MRGIIAIIFILALAIFPAVPYIFGEKTTVAVYNSGRTGGIGAGVNGFYAIPSEDQDKPTLSKRQLEVQDTIIPDTVGGGVERTAYRYADNYYLVGFTYAMLPSVILLALFAGLFGLGVAARIIGPGAPKKKS